MKSRLIRPWFLAGLILLSFGLLQIVGSSHKHTAGQDHTECQLCHAAAQPFLSDTPPTVLPVFSELRLLLPERPIQALSLPLVAHSARGPPSV
ncbi:MAG: hypothetical protein ABIW76_06965 [Fibrobacteria bacterium]